MRETTGRLPAALLSALLALLACAPAGALARRVPRERLPGGLVRRLGVPLPVTSLVAVLAPAGIDLARRTAALQEREAAR